MHGCKVAGRTQFSSSFASTACIQNAYCLLRETLRPPDAGAVMIFSSRCGFEGGAMDTCGRLVDSSPLSVQCPRCGLAEVDDYEVVEANCIQSMHCTGCGTVIRFAVIECPRCGEETLYTLSSEAAAQDLCNPVCAACEQRHVDKAVSTLRAA